MKGRSVPKIPGQLLDELGSSHPTSNGRPKEKPKKALESRKEQRKALRAEKKARRHQHRSRLPKAAVEADEEDDGFIADPWGGDKDASQDESPQKPLKSILKKPTKQSSAAAINDDGSQSPPPKVSRKVKERLADDGAGIAALEKKLGLKGKSKLPKSFEEDGLGDLLGGLDDFVASTGKRKRGEYEAWLKNKRRKENTDVFEGFSGEDAEPPFQVASEGEHHDNSTSEVLFESEDEESGDDVGGREDEDIEEDSEDIFGDEDFDHDFDDSEDEIRTARSTRRVRENPYKPPIAPGDDNSAADSGLKFIPPALRATATSDDEILAKLRRQLQGLLNRLSEANMLTILKDIEQIYQSNSRQHVTSTLIELLLALICDRTSLNDTFITLHAAFIASVYKATGTQFGAQLLDRLVAEFDKQYSLQSSDPISSKEATNLIALLTELYTFQVVSSTIIFDYIRSLLSSISELNTELLLKIIRNCGPQLRSEDPTSLKDIVLLLQRAVAARGGEEKLPVRTKFMIETINNLKNNRHKAGAEASALAQEHRTRVKKTLGTLNARAKTKEPLGMSLEDLRNSKEEGQWWLVGARWKTPQAPTSNDANPSPITSQNPQSQSSAEPDISTLALAAGMNTFVRRSIFTTLLSASDYKDCISRLHSLRLSRKQELEIPRVLLACAGQEQSYNRYYILVAKKLCGEHRMRMALQFALWGVWRGWAERFVGVDEQEDEGEEWEEGEGKNGGLRKVVNLARLYGDLVGQGNLPITILKTLDFAYLKEKTRLFVEVMLLSVLQKMGKDEDGVIRVFAKARDALQMVTGLRFFLESMVLKTDVVTAKEKEVVKKGCKAAIAALDLLVNAGAR